jgi:hypothetical protein
MGNFSFHKKLLELLSRSMKPAFDRRIAQVDVLRDARDTLILKVVAFD